MGSEHVIVRVIRRHNPSADIPPDNGRTWTKMLCPYHDEEVASAAISYKLEAFNCLACGMKGNVVNLVMKREEVDVATAREICEKLSEGCDREVRREPARQPRRRVFGDSWSDEQAPRDVPSRIRTRATPWS